MIVIGLLLLGLALCHQSYEERHSFTDFNQHNGWIFLTSFTFEPDQAKLELELTVEGV